MAKNKLLIIGLGETANLAYEYFTHDSEYEVAAFAASHEYIKELFFLGLPVITLEDIEHKYPPNDYFAFVAMAGSHLNRDRTMVYNKVKQFGYRLVSYVSSKAFVWHNVKIGENCFILEDNTLQPFTEIGNNVVMWSGNHLGHQSKIKDNCFITSHVVISGFCTIGENTFMGVNSSVRDEVEIAKDNVIGMGAVITKNTEENRVYIGNPAKPTALSAKHTCKVEE